MYQSFIGREFGKLTVTGEDLDKNGERVCICDCKCGKSAHRVLKHNLTSTTSPTTSCSCHRSEMLRRRMSKSGNPDETNRLVREFREQGFSCRKIGSKVNLSGARVQQILAASRN